MNCFMEEAREVDDLQGISTVNFEVLCVWMAPSAIWVGSYEFGGGGSGAGGGGSVGAGLVVVAVVETGGVAMVGGKRVYSVGRVARH